MMASIKRHCLFTKSVILFSLSTLSFCVIGQIDDQAMFKSTVKIHVKSASGTGVASGFVWQKKNQVITALHAIRPKPAKILVLCNGVPYKAVVEKVLQDADLALLKTEADLAQCEPLSRMSSQKPPPRSPLVAFGFKPDVKAATTKDLKKGSANDETLKNLVSDKMIEPMKSLNMPSLELPVYFVTGGIYKGYSGAPVVDESGALIGVVEGGLDRGTSNHNWLIPASNIERLLASSVVDDVPIDLDDQEHFFSVVTLTEDNQDDLLVYQDANNAYRWIKTKTRSFDKLIETAEPGLLLDEVYMSIIPEKITIAEQLLKFDIYEEEDLGLIIAIPHGIKLKHVPVDDDWQLVATDSTGSQATFTVQHGAYQFTSDQGGEITPNDARFFELQIDAMLAMCDEAHIDCELQDEHFRIVDFGAGNQILRIGYTVDNLQTGVTNYRYKSIVVKDDNALIVDASINFGADSAVNRCFEKNSSQACGEAFWEPASFMLATALTSFSNLALEGQEPVVTRPFDYDCEDCEATSHTEQADYSQTSDAHVMHQQVTYQDYNGQPIFVYEPEEGWLVFIQDEYFKATEINREVADNGIEHVTLLVADYQFYLPLSGGTYYQSYAGSEWLEQADVVLR